MRQQTKPFIVEKKPSRKPKTGSSKPSIWGKLDLSVNPDHHDDGEVAKTTAANGGRPSLNEPAYAAIDSPDAAG